MTNGKQRRERQRVFAIRRANKALAVLRNLGYEYDGKLWLAPSKEETPEKLGYRGPVSRPGKAEDLVGPKGTTGYDAMSKGELIDALRAANKNVGTLNLYNQSLMRSVGRLKGETKTLVCTIKRLKLVCYGLLGCAVVLGVALAF